MTAPFGEQPTRVETSPGGVGFIRTEASKDLPAMPEGERQAWLREWGELHAAFAEADAQLQEWDWPRACPWCASTVPVSVPTVLVDGEHVCQECAL